MNQKEQKQVSKGLSDLIAALETLSQQQITATSGWPNIACAINNAHKYFQKVLDKMIEPCKDLMSNLDKDWYYFEDWQFYIEDLWETVGYLRRMHNRLFGNEYSSLLYHHIFVDEIFNCFPKTLKGASM